MMNKFSFQIITILFSLTLLFSCDSSTKKIEKEETVSSLKLSIKNANQLAVLPLKCVEQEYPNKLGQVISSEEDLLSPKDLHPVFYGCFDWHSAVHGHWSLVKLLKEFPELKQADSIKNLLRSKISKENIAKEIAYFDRKHSKTYERTYGWAWLLKLAEEIHNWDTPLARELESNLQPLSSLIAKNYVAYLPKLKYPIRVGTHSNTAFGLSFAYDYAIALDDTELKSIIIKRGKDFYYQDTGCPINWEPSGHDFLSPCLEEIDIMKKILAKEDFMNWINHFLPEITQNTFDIAVGEVSDRSDGHLVHLDGLNFSRAWCFKNLATYPEFRHLNQLANKHINYSLPNLIGDDYMGGHWLASFAIYALAEKE